MLALGGLVVTRRFEMLSIGDELLDGRVTDSNTVRLAQALGTVGEHLSHRATVTDDIDAIVAAGQDCIRRGTQVCIVSGGLGPTTDDLTAAALARLAGVSLLRDAAEVQHITALLRRRRRHVTANQLRQADRPQGAQRVANPVGTAPGFSLEVQGCRFVALPGVPKEFDPMLQQAVLDDLAQARQLERRVLYCVGLMESEADRRLDGLLPAASPVRLQYRVKFPEVHVSMHAPQPAVADLEAAFDEAQRRLQPHVYATHQQGEGFAAQLLRECRARGATLAVAESCTGGLISNLLTDVPGSSDIFLMGIIAYSYGAKQIWLGVEEATLSEHGAVSEVVVQQMARGVQQRAGSTWALSASGIAGPGGGLPNKPVGTVWLALHGPTGTHTCCLRLTHDRLGNKLHSAYAALQLLRQHLLGLPAA